MAVLDPKAPRRKRRLKRWYLAHGGVRSGIPKGFRVVSPRVGKPARALIRAVQRMAKLPVSGQFDPDTLRLLFPPSRRELVMRIVRRELGTHEWPSGSNWGPVKKYLAAVHIRFGAPWCAAFVTWVLKEHGYRGPLPPLPAYCPSWHGWAKGKGLLKPVALAKRGDILLFDWDGGAADHIGFCTGGLIGKQISTIEGNVGDYGGQVTRKTRTLLTIETCIDLGRLLDLDKNAS